MYPPCPKAAPLTFFGVNLESHLPPTRPNCSVWLFLRQGSVQTIMPLRGLGDSTLAETSAEFRIAAHGRCDLLHRPCQGMVQETRLLSLQIGEPEADERRDAKRRRVAPDLAARGFKFGERGGHGFRCAHIAGVPEVGILGGQLEHARTFASHQQRRPACPWTARRDVAVARLIILAREIDMPFLQQWPQDLQGFCEAVHAMIEGQAERLVLRLVPSRADPQDQAPTAHLVGWRWIFAPCAITSRRWPTSQTQLLSVAGNARASRRTCMSSRLLTPG